MNPSSSQRGQAIVEFAIILPLLILLLLGIFFVSSAFHLQGTLNSAARDGSRLWASQRVGNATSPTFARQFDAVALKLLADNGYDPQKLVITPVTSYAQELNEAQWNEISTSAEDSTKVKLVLIYPVQINIGTFEFLTVNVTASYTFKKG